MKYKVLNPKGVLSCMTFFLLMKICAINLNGQNLGPAAEKGPVYKYTFNILYLNYSTSGNSGKEQPLNIKFYSDERVIHISAYEGGISRYYSHEGPASLSFYRKDGTDDAGEIKYKVVLNVAMGESGQKLIFVVRKPNGMLSARTFDMSLKDFPLNSFRMLNFSQQEVKVRIAKEVGVVAPFKSRNFPVELQKRKSAIGFALATEVDRETKLIEMTRLAFTKNGRRLIVIYNDVRQPEEIRYRVFHIARPVAVENESDVELEVEDYKKYERQERMAQ